MNNARLGPWTGDNFQAAYFPGALIQTPLIIEGIWLVTRRASEYHHAENE